MAFQSFFGARGPSVNQQRLQNAEVKLDRVTREINGCQDGVRDIANKLGHNAGLNAKVADLAARVTVSQTSRQRLHDELQNKLDAMNRADEKAQEVLLSNSQAPDTNWVAHVAPVAQRLLPTYLALFGDLNLIRDISDEHKVLFYNKELADLQARYEALQTQLNDRAVPDAREYVPRAELDEAEGRSTAVRVAMMSTTKGLEREKALRQDADTHVSRLKEEADVHQAKLKNLEAELEAVKQTKSLERDIAKDKHRQEIQQQQDDKRHLQTSLEESQSTRATLQGERDNLHVQLLAAQQRNHDLTSAQSQMGHENDDVQAKLDNALLEIQELKIRNNIDKMKISAQENEISNLQHTVADGQKQAEAKSADYDAMSAMHDSARALFKKANMEFETCRVQVQEAEDKIQTLKDSSAEMSAQYNEAFTAGELARQEIDALKTSVDTLQSAKGDLSAQRNELELTALCL